MFFYYIELFGKFLLFRYEFWSLLLRAVKNSHLLYVVKNLRMVLLNLNPEAER
ncbi:hypothetical protein C1646_681956 [Rhizophagus diaphanus]|nr:hypothetical protein C1646_681956 [Rhizophagus diaphanus] [Rhizophagus sp. MUCL 43196]